VEKVFLSTLRKGAVAWLVTIDAGRRFPIYHHRPDAESFWAIEGSDVRLYTCGEGNTNK